jgi:20S proteasome alpha/beta subunit
MKFLNPFLSSGEYKKALLKPEVNDVIKGIAESIRKDREDAEQPTFSCGLVLCGFDDTKKPYMLDLGRFGVCTDMTPTGFCATGSGSGYALQRLLSSEWKRTYSIDRALFELFDAKVQAENDMNVGYDWDAIVITRDSCSLVPDDIKQMIDRAWIKINRSPYEKYNPDEDKPLPPDDWMDKLKAFADSIKL